MGNGAEVTAVGLGREDLVADVEQGVHPPAVGVVNEDESRFFHLSAIASDTALLFSFDRF